MHLWRRAVGNARLIYASRMAAKWRKLPPVADHRHVYAFDEILYMKLYKVAQRVQKTRFYVQIISGVTVTVATFPRVE